MTIELLIAGLVVACVLGITFPRFFERVAGM